MSGLLSNKISFDAEDRPPLSYYSKDTLEDSFPQTHKSTKKIDEAEWVKAPEFVPRKQRVGVGTPFGYFSETTPGPEDPHHLPRFAPNFVANLLQPVIRQPHSPHLRAPFLQLPFIHPGLLPMGPMPGSIGHGGFRLPMRPPMMNHHGHPTKGPLRPSIQLSKTLQSGGARTTVGFPHGYSANVTTINSGVGPPIPAIVLKKKRKKRNKNKIKDGITDSKDSESIEGKDSSPDNIEICKRSSEPDLTKLDTPQSHEISHNNKFHNDPDVIQAAVDSEGCMLTGSCPDLSQAQRDYFEQFWDECMDGGNNDSDGLPPADPMLTSEYDVASPAVFSALQDVATDSQVRSNAVRALDRKVVEEMGLSEKLMSSYVQENEDEESDGEERLYDRLIKDTHDRLKDKLPNPGGAPRSLLDELEEGKTNFNPFTHESKNKYGHDFYPPCTYVEEDEFNGMHITVNAFQDPEELIIDEEPIEGVGRMTKLHGAFNKLKASISEPQLHQPPKPCCSLM